MKIPKKIHYCWFGGNEKPDIVCKCIESWKKYMPDYEIIEWNELNYDCHKVPYIDQAYKEKKWAFISDYARFDIINEYGGIYMDTDVELLKSIPDYILQNQAFTAMEPLGFVSPGLIFASVPNFEIVQKLLDVYSSENFIVDGRPVYKTVNKYITELLETKGYKKMDIFQKIDNLAIYPSEYFCGFDLDIHEIAITDNTISVHHYAGTWREKSLKRKVQKLLKKFLGKKKYKKLLLLVRKVRDRNGKNYNKK